MTGPGGWEATVTLKARVAATPPVAYALAPVTLDGEVALEGEYRAAWNVVNGTGPITLGWIWIEYRDITTGGAWVENGLQFKNTAPGYTLTVPGEPPVQIVGEDSDFFVGYPSPLVRDIRARFDWTDGPHYSQVVHAIARESDVLVGALDDFFRDFDVVASINEGEKKVRAITEAPYRETLGISGKTRTLLVERALVAEYPIGTPVALDDGSLHRIVREVSAGAADLVRWQLEEVA